MKVTWPDVDFQAWQQTLTDWQLKALVEVGRGYFNDYEGHDRMQVVQTDYGFDVLGLHRVTAFTSDGAPVEDAWQLGWVCEVHPSSINHGDWEGKYKSGRRRGLHGLPRRGRERHDRERSLDRHSRTQARWMRRRKRREQRIRAWQETELARLQRELQEWVGSPLSFPEYDRIAELQSELGQEQERDGSFR